MNFSFFIARRYFFSKSKEFNLFLFLAIEIVFILLFVSFVAVFQDSFGALFEIDATNAMVIITTILKYIPSLILATVPIVAFFYFKKIDYRNFLIFVALQLFGLLLFIISSWLLGLTLNTLSKSFEIPDYFNLLYILPVLISILPIALYLILQHSFISFLSISSVFGVSICTAALVVVLSVFNGLEGLLYSLYSTFDPEIKIEAVKGKSFTYDEDFKQKVAGIEGIESIVEVIEDYAYVKYREADRVVTMKGVSEEFIGQGRMNNNIVEGDFKLKKDGVNYAVVGRGIQYALSLNTSDDLTTLQVFYIKDPKSGSIDPNKIYSKKNILPGSIFAIEQNYDENYIIVPVEFAQELLNYGNKRTALELKLLGNVDEVISALREAIGSDFLVQNRYEQQADLYKLLNLEKFFVFLAFSFILAVGSINIFFSLSMLALDKKKDIAVLYAMGATDSTIKRIFMSEGAIISLGGAFLGVTLGAIVCVIQQKYGLVSMGTQSTVITSYPVKMQLTDFVYTALSIVAITFVASYRPAKLASKFNEAHHL